MPRLPPGSDTLSILWGRIATRLQILPLVRLGEGEGAEVTQDQAFFAAQIQATEPNQSGLNHQAILYDAYDHEFYGEAYFFTALDAEKWLKEEQERIVRLVLKNQRLWIEVQFGRRFE